PPEVKLEEPHFPCKIEGLYHLGMECAGKPQDGPPGVDARPFAGMHQVDVTHRDPGGFLVRDAETRQQVLHDALHVGEVDRRPAALPASPRPVPGEEAPDWRAL